MEDVDFGGLDQELDLGDGFGAGEAPLEIEGQKHLNKGKGKGQHASLQEAHQVLPRVRFCFHPAERRPSDFRLPASQRLGCF